MMNDRWIQQRKLSLTNDRSLLLGRSLFQDLIDKMESLQRIRPQAVEEDLHVCFGRSQMAKYGRELWRTA